MSDNSRGKLKPSAETPLMRKQSRTADDDPVISNFRRGMIRYGFRRYLYMIACVLLCFLVVRWFYRQPTTYPSNIQVGYRGEVMAPGKPEAAKLNSVNLEIYMESQCPDTSRFIHKQLKKAWASLGDTGRVDLTIIPFGKARCIEKGEDFECSCQHGANECILNQLMNCVIDRVGFPDKYVPIIECIQGRPNLDSAMAQCIVNNPLLNAKQMLECTNGQRGRRLLALAGSKTVGLKPSMTFVPWIVIDGERNSDALYDLTENLCKKLEPAPEACSVYENKADRR